jgi:hypothetical protein
MGENHERFEAMAVGHVLGGLGTTEANGFREHLLSCRACRARVAELREMAADLAAVERAERAREVVRTQVSDEVDDDETFEPVGRPRAARHLAIVAAFVALAAGVLGFWNLHLRTVAASSTALASRQDEALELLATGVALHPEVADGLQAIAAGDDDAIAFSISGLELLGDDEMLIGWTTGGALLEPQVRWRLRANQFGGGSLAARIELAGGDRFVLTRERGAPSGEPDGLRLLVVDPADAVGERDVGRDTDAGSAPVLSEPTDGVGGDPP